MRYPPVLVTVTVEGMLLDRRCVGLSHFLCLGFAVHSTLVNLPSGPSFPPVSRQNRGVGRPLIFTFRFDANRVIEDNDANSNASQEFVMISKHVQQLSF